MIGIWGPTSEAGPISTLIDGGVSDPAFSADGRRVAVRVADGAEVRDAARPAEPGVTIVAPAGGTFVRDGFELSDDGSVVLAVRRHGIALRRRRRDRRADLGAR